MTESLNTNITTSLGEVRSCDQYVLAPGSFVPVSEKEKETNDPKLGCYTVANAIPPTKIKFEQLPDIFLEQIKKNKEQEQKILLQPKKTVKPTGKHSALFDLTISDVIGGHKQDSRYPHPLHDSDTGQNFMIGDKLAHCWRHLVSLNALQFLVVKSGFMPCEDAGTGHKKNASPSMVVGNNGAVFHAWKQAKLEDLISKDDPIPVRAMRYIATEHKLVSKDFKFVGKLPREIYNNVLKTVEELY